MQDMPELREYHRQLADSRHGFTIEDWRAMLILQTHSQMHRYGLEYIYMYTVDVLYLPCSRKVFKTHPSNIMLHNSKEWYHQLFILYSSRYWVAVSLEEAETLRGIVHNTQGWLVKGSSCAIGMMARNSIYNFGFV